MQGLGYKKKDNEYILLDISNGVGGLRIGPFKVAIQKYFNFDVLNDKNQEQLNVGCGAEFVHKEQQYPLGFVERLKTFPDLKNVRCVSYDGDSDRIVYLYFYIYIIIFLYKQKQSLPTNDLKQIRLMDGDKMISLFALYFKTALNNLEKAVEAANNTGDVKIQDLKPKHWNIGMVQTPYANGSSSIYLKEKLGLNVFFHLMEQKTYTLMRIKMILESIANQMGMEHFLYRKKEPKNYTRQFFNQKRPKLEMRKILKFFMIVCIKLNNFIDIQEFAIKVQVILLPICFVLKLQWQLLTLVMKIILECMMIQNAKILKLLLKIKAEQKFLILKTKFQNLKNCKINQMPLLLYILEVGLLLGLQVLKILQEFMQNIKTWRLLIKFLKKQLK
ncbi:n-acetylglucosamine-phosphate mutase, putative [Ichthyophthirius multifiliis]|uniref:N-acetylglucosamine-phosphate mutase, putative n=1 Tax=Ichthyophthirius multifiliis TaxID=5932 RepID=G0R0G9_ICHMU|nr:n-acetylglucosamine-phosphate mutase, putative [Ichthyophthirius multifiliis]EGR29020.1 n-acetylglucosamine-phosphate mutase, putative [Ichthyophthirius multifiliis]|eukprot:XP_004030256.1 n-acetylglucosamine-phosphate mutase, putative [Ichthyophthirius multifiliis]